MLGTNYKAKTHSKKNNAYYENNVNNVIKTARTAENDIVNLTDYVNLKTLPKITSQLFQKVVNMINMIRRNTRNVSNFLNLLQKTFVSNTWITLQYSSKHIQSSRYDITTYRYYSIKTGCYDVKALFDLSVSNSATEYQLGLYKNGSAYKLLDAEYNNKSHLCLNGDCVVYLECGDYIEVKFRHNDILPMQFADVYGYFDVHFSGCNASLTNFIIDITWSL
jgi:hypothetical protein